MSISGKFPGNEKIVVIRLCPTEAVDEATLEMHCQRHGNFFISSEKKNDGNFILRFYGMKSALEALSRFPAEWQAVLEEEEERKKNFARTLSIPVKGPSNWKEEDSFQAQLEDFERMGKHDLHNRYIVLGNLPESIRTASDVYRSYLRNIVHLEDLEKIEFLEAKNKIVRVAHITFVSAWVASAVSNSLATIAREEPDEEKRFIYCFGPPRMAGRKLWFASGGFSEKQKENFLEILKSYGEIEDSIVIPRRGCAFATFSNLSDSIKARNELIFSTEIFGDKFPLNCDFVPLKDLRRISEKLGDNDDAGNSVEISEEIKEVVVPEICLEEFKISKLKEFMCSVKGVLIGGRRRAKESVDRWIEDLEMKIEVDQRAKIDKIFQAFNECQGDLSVWELELSNRETSEKLGYENLVKYFEGKERLGYVEDREAGKLFFLVPGNFFISQENSEKLKKNCKFFDEREKSIDFFASRLFAIIVDINGDERNRSNSYSREDSRKNMNKIKRRRW